MNDSVFASLHNAEELPLGGRVSWVNETTLRLKLMAYPATMPDLPNRAKWNPGPATGVEVELEEGERRVLLRDKPLRWELFRSGKRVFGATITEFSRKNRRVTLHSDAQADTRFYGLGGQFLSVEHSGREIECQSTDPWGEHHLREPHWANIYYPVPWLWTTDGYALLFNAAVPLTFRFPERGATAEGFTVAIDTPALDVTLIEAATPADALQEYARLVGKPYVPPKWAMEPLIGHASNHAGKCFNPRVLDEYLTRMRENHLPNGIIFDEAWSWTSPEPDGQGGTRLWFHPEKLGDFRIHNFTPEAAGIEAARAAGQKYVLHITPFIGLESEYVAELKERGYLVMRASDPSLPLVGQYHHHFLDFTNPDAVKWYQDHLRRLLSLGADGFFSDFGEADDQRDALYFRGTGASCGQVYSVLNKQAIDEVCREVLGNDYFFISRAGWTGTQKYAGALIGDQPGTFDGMRWVVSAMLSLALSGQGVCAHNQGGYAGQQESTVYLRWMQLGVFSPLFVMWNSGPTGEPWTFDAYTISEYRRSAEFRMRILPYLHSCLHEYGRTGLPLLRPMTLLHPENVEMAGKLEQFFCGSEMLVAPVFSYDGQVTLTLPEGDWLDYWTGEAVSGGRDITVCHPMETFPVFVRRGGLVPMEVKPERVNVAQSDLEIHVFGVGENRFMLHDDGTDALLTCAPQDGALELSAEALPRPTLIWTGHGIPLPREAIFTDANGAESRPAIEEKDGVWSARVPGGGGRLTLRLG